MRTLVHATTGSTTACRPASSGLPRAQSMIMVCVSKGITSPKETAERLKVSKQSIRQALRPMIEGGLVTVGPDPANRRQRIVQVTERGQAARDVARRGLERLEKELARRIGRDRLETLHEVLNLNWGPSPTEAPDPQ